MKFNIFFKNIYSIIWILLPFIFVTLILVSCQDENESSVSNINHKTMFQGYSDAQIEDELILFLNQLDTIRNDSNDPLADEVLELEPILWYLEACVNYKYGVSVQPELVKIDTSYVNFIVSGTTYKLGDVQVSYDAVVDSIAAYFYELREEEKYFLMTNISVANQTSQNITLQVISYFTLNGIIPDVNDYDWYWGFELGQCGTHNESPLDATDIIMRGANASIYIPAPEFYYTDIQIGYSGYPYTILNNNNEPLGFYSPAYTYQNCISEEEISFFTSGLISIGESNIPNNLEICSYFVEPLATLWVDHPNYRFHSAKVTCGIHHYRTQSVESLPNNQNNI